LNGERKLYINHFLRLQIFSQRHQISCINITLNTNFTFFHYSSIKIKAMRILYLLPAVLFVTMTACNSGTQNSASSDTTTSTADTSMNAMMDTSATSTPAMEAAPAGAKVFFKNLKNGQTVTSPFKVEMGVSGIALDTAGSMTPNTGHHHLLVDDGDSIPMGTVVPKDSTHLHFGKAQKETTLTLAPGKHKLTLQLADGLHRSYGAQLAATITVNVKK
jgi:hypothetical protein